MFYENYYWGMNWIWWGLWILALFWIYATPYSIPGQRFKKETALDILKKRLALNEISLEEYKERKKAIDN
jgi:putative membrane protein